MVNYISIVHSKAVNGEDDLIPNAENEEADSGGITGIAKTIGDFMKDPASAAGPLSSALGAFCKKPF